MNRIDLYSIVHKMQRARLFALVVEAGRIDPEDLAAVANLRAAVESMVGELRAHADHEHVFIHPLLRAKAPELAAELDSAHAQLDVEMGALTDGLAPPDLYRALARFTSAYLTHLAREEDAAMPAMWAACTNEDFLGVFGAFRKARSPVENLTAVLAELPTLSPGEAAAFLTTALSDVKPADLAEILGSLLGPVGRGAVARAIKARAGT